jgi:TrmH family RNA methyltransferase
MAAKRITSRENPTVKAVIGIASSSRERRLRGETVLDGPHLVQAYHASGRRARIVVASDTGMEKPEIHMLFEQVAAEERLLVSDRLFADIAQVATPAGIAAVIATPRPVALPAKLETCLFLEGLQDWGNVGSILRSAAAAGLRQVFMSKGSVFAWSPKVLRAGQGAHFFLDIFEDVDLVALASRFPGAVLCTEPVAGQSLFEADLTGPIAWVFGNEGAGISEALAAAATLRLRIPMPGPAESLNVAAAAAICLFEQVRQRAGAG